MVHFAPGKAPPRAVVLATPGNNATKHGNPDPPDDVLYWCRACNGMATALLIQSICLIIGAYFDGTRPLRGVFATRSRKCNVAIAFTMFAYAAAMLRTSYVTCCLICGTTVSRALLWCPMANDETIAKGGAEGGNRCAHARHALLIFVATTSVIQVGIVMVAARVLFYLGYLARCMDALRTWLRRCCSACARRPPPPPAAHVQYDRRVQSAMHNDVTPPAD